MIDPKMIVVLLDLLLCSCATADLHFAMLSEGAFCGKNSYGRCHMNLCLLRSLLVRVLLEALKDCKAELLSLSVVTNHALVSLSLFTVDVEIL